MHGSALANERYFAGERLQEAEAKKADEQLHALTRVYNDEISGGKWRHFMTMEPADTQFKSMRIDPWVMPKVSSLAQRRQPAQGTTLPAGSYTSKTDRPSASWQRVPGLGRTANAVTVLPSTAASISIANVVGQAPRLEYEFAAPSSGEINVTINLLPTFPLNGSAGLQLALAIDDEQPSVVSASKGDGSPEWSQGVLSSTISASIKLNVRTGGKHRLKIYMLDAGVVIDDINIARIGSL